MIRAACSAAACRGFGPTRHREENAALPVVTPTAATVLATEKEAGAGTSASANREDGPDTNPAALPGKRTREGDVRFIERYNYTRRSLRKVAEELCWSGKDEFFKVVSCG